jgi:hypothetical protein
MADREITAAAITLAQEMIAASGRQCGACSLCCKYAGSEYEIALTRNEPMRRQQHRKQRS